MSEESKALILKPSLVEMSRTRGIRRAGIKIIANGEDVLTLTYVPDSSLVIIIDGQTIASGLGLITNLEKDGHAMALKINAYLGLKHIKIDESRLIFLMETLKAFNDNESVFVTDFKVKEKGSRAKRVYSIDMGRAILSLDTSNILTIDDGLGETEEFELLNCVDVDINLEMVDNPNSKDEEDIDNISIDNDFLKSKVKSFKSETKCNLNKYSEEELFKVIKILLISQAKNLKELNALEIKKQKKAEQQLHKELKPGNKKMLFYVMITNIIDSYKYTDSEVYNRLSLEYYYPDYSKYILEVVEPIYKLTQKKGVTEYLGSSIEDINSKEFIDAYIKILKEIIPLFFPDKGIVCPSSMPKLDYFDCL